MYTNMYIYIYICIYIYIYISPVVPTAFFSFSRLFRNLWQKAGSELQSVWAVFRGE